MKYWYVSTRLEIHSLIQSRFWNDVRNSVTSDGSPRIAILGKILVYVHCSFASTELTSKHMTTFLLLLQDFLEFALASWSWQKFCCWNNIQSPTKAGCCRNARKVLAWAKSASDSRHLLPGQPCLPRSSLRFHGGGVIPSPK